MTRMYFFTDDYGRRVGVSFPLCDEHAKTQRIPEGQYMKAGIVTGMTCDTCALESDRKKSK